MTSFEVRPIGKVESPLTDLQSTPLQADEGAPEAWLVFEPEVLEGLRCLQPSDQVIIITWLDRARRDVLSVHPRGDPSRAQESVSVRALLIARIPSACTGSRSLPSTAAAAPSRSVGWDANHRRQANT